MQIGDRLLFPAMIFLPSALLLGCDCVILVGADTDTDSPAGEEPSSSGTSEGPDPSESGCQPEWDSAKEILSVRCTGCHAKGGGNIFDIVLDEQAMLNSPKGYIKPGDLAGSLVYSKIFSEEMPPEGASPLSAEEKDIIADYIECLAPLDSDPFPPANCDPGLHLTHADVVHLIREDVLARPAEARPLRRYLSLAHLRNAGNCEGEIQSHTHALNKLVNSLSRANKLVKLEPVAGSEGLILSLDLEDFQISPVLWREIACSNPFVVDLSGNDDVGGDDARDIAVQTGEKLFVQPGDAFLSITSRPPLYHDILGIPATLTGPGSLEELELFNLEADVADEIANNKERLARAGLIESGVAEFNRIVQWHEIAGAPGEDCWVSFDFASEETFENIIESPLDFKADANEVICSLPNGLQTYFIAIDGQRVDEADANVVKNNQHEGDIIENGVSCMLCHREGVIAATDVLRGKIESQLKLDPSVVEKVQKLHPPKADFDKLLAASRSRFLKALHALDVPSSIETANGSYEPIFLVDLVFGERLDLVRVAAELGTESGIVETILDDGVGLKNLKGGGTIERGAFEVGFSQAFELLELGDASPLEACTSITDP